MFLYRLIPQRLHKCAIKFFPFLVGWKSFFSINSIYVFHLQIAPILLKKYIPTNLYNFHLFGIIIKRKTGTCLVYVTLRYGIYDATGDCCRSSPYWVRLPPDPFSHELPFVFLSNILVLPHQLLPSSHFGYSIGIFYFSNHSHNPPISHF